ncbi:MAG: hypothetical protein ACLGHN_11710 [Bacteriovoracia bacterium]
MKEIESKITNIISNFRHLFPTETTMEEIFLLENSVPEILLIAPGKIQIYFVLKKVELEKIKSSIYKIEDSLNLKSKIILKWFPDIEIINIKIKDFEVSRVAS